MKYTGLLTETAKIIILFTEKTGTLKYENLENKVFLPENESLPLIVVRPDKHI